MRFEGKTTIHLNWPRHLPGRGTRSTAVAIGVSHQVNQTSEAHVPSM